jgi:hypothetical protein
MANILNSIINIFGADRNPVTVRSGQSHGENNWRFISSTYSLFTYDSIRDRKARRWENL